MTTTSVAGSARLADRSPRTWAGYAGFGWSLAYLLVAHLPMLLTGRPLLPFAEDPTGGLSAIQERVAEAGVCLLLLGTALTSLALVRPWGRVFPRWALLGVAWVGGLIGLLHWAIWTWQSLERMAGWAVVPAPAGVTEQVWAAFVREYDLLNVFLYEPWFLGMGLFLCLGATQNVRSRRAADRSEAAVSPVSAVSPPAWATWRGWPGYLLVVWAVLGAAAQLSWGLGSTYASTLGLPVPESHTELMSIVRPGFLLLGVLTAIVLPFGPLLVHGQGGRRLPIVAQVLSGLYLLGGLVVLLAGIMIYDPWVFAAYGPALMGGGILLELTLWRNRELRDQSEA